MKKKKITVVLILLIMAIPVYFLACYLNNRLSLQEKITDVDNDFAKEMDGQSILNKRSGFEREKLSAEDNNKMLGQFLGLESEKNESVNSVNQWLSIGPYGLNVGSTSKRSGRVKDLEFEGLPSLRVVSATGGVWKYMVAGIVVLPIPMGDNIGCPTLGAFATRPGDSNTVIVGTGESGFGLGNGLWRTTNGGQTWDSLSVLNGFGPTSHRIKFAPSDNNLVHYANDYGYYRSTTGGANWTKILSANVTDVEVHPTDNNILYIVKAQDGLYKSTDAGLTFNIVSSFFVTGSNLGRACLSISKSNPNYLYLAISNTSGHAYAIMRTTNAGGSWQIRTIKDGGGVDVDFTYNGSTAQGLYDLCIAVNPVDPNIVVAGGIGMYKTTNGGLNWNIIPDMHSDQHIAKWHSNGSTLYIGNDGGVYVSTDVGATFSANLNILPTLQFIDFDITASNGIFHVIGGMQDNNVSITHTATLNSIGTWYDVLSGDGYAVSINKGNSNNMIAKYNASVSRSTDGGTTWGDGTGGGAFPDCTTLRDDRITPVFLYTANSNKIFNSSNYGSNWSQLGVTLPFNAGTINASVWSSVNGTAVYAINEVQPSNSNNMLAVMDNGVLYTNRTSSLPVGKIRKISVHPTNPQVAFAIMQDINLTQRVFKTTNRGVNWSDITGNLPHMDLNDVSGHPTNSSIYYLGSTFGVLKGTTTGSVTNWVRWSNGMPKTVIVTYLAPIDSSSINGRFYIAAGTYGRGVLVREVSGDDPVTGIIDNKIISRYELSQNYPNPFNPVTKINFTISSGDNVKIEVFDITGRSVNILTNQKFSAGHHSVQFNGEGISSGVYFYKLTSSKFSDVKKMILLK